MPELPEVETIRIGLSKRVLGLKIKSVEVRSPKSFEGDNSLLKGMVVKDVWRRAKVLGIELASGVSVIIHLKMTGQLIYQGKVVLAGGHPTKDMAGEMPNKSTRVIITFSDNSKLFFNDQRRFGWMKVIQNNELGIMNNGFLNKLGPEPLDEKFTWQVLKEKLLKRKSMPVKVTIMDQEIISGVGNIYAAEAVFIAKIDPRKKVKDLTDQEIKKLHQGIIKSLEDGIKYGGSSREHYLNVEGEKGSFLDYANVYGREGEDCKRCQTKLEKIKQAGRSTVFCPNCQL